MTSKISFEQFVPLALRTESRLDAVKMDKETLIALLRVGIAAGEVLDVVKKSVFYNKPSKFDANIIETLEQVQYAFNDATDALNCAYNDKPSEALDSKNADYELNPRLLHCILGKFTESAELLSAIHKTLSTGTPLDTVNVMEELGDDQWYDAVIVDETGIDLDTARFRVINKLSIRYPDKFDDVKASERDLDAERKALEGN